MKIGILGSGLMGAKLGTLLAHAGHEVTFSYARGREKLEGLAREAGKGARAGSPSEAAKDADAVILAVHWNRFDEVLAQAGDLSGKVVITCSLPMDDDNAKLVVGTDSSGAEALAKRLPNSKVVSAFNTIPSEVLFGVFDARSLRKGPDLVYCGDDAKSKEVAAALIRELGFTPVDAGPLRIARYTEPFALLVAALAYDGDGGPELAYRFERVGG